MGCGNSKQKLCRNCKSSSSSYPPLLRSYSMESPATTADNDHHTVVLASSTLGHPLTVKLDLLDHKHQEISLGEKQAATQLKKIEEISIEKINDEPTRIWSKWMDEKVKKIVPKTPTKTPTGKPEIIDAWELMEGLNSPVTTLKPPFHSYTRSFSFHFSSYQPFDDDLTPAIEKKVPPSLDGNYQLVAPVPARLQELRDTAVPAPVDDSKKPVYRTAGGNKPPVTQTKEKLIMYFTSLRGIRKTYDDCCDVRNILKQLGVKVDERDVSMHSEFKTELKELLHNEGSIVLPKVFIGRRLIGGVEDIRQIHEEGELKKAVEGVAVAEDGGRCGGVCEVCGDVRFVPCGMCYGSCKVYNEGDYDKSIISGFKRCNDCNENGLVRCPICTSL